MIKLTPGQEYTIMNKEQLTLLYGKEGFDIHFGRVDPNFLGMKIRATYPCALHPTKEQGGNGCICFSHLDTLEIVLANNKIDIQSQIIDYYHDGDAYYKRKIVNITPELRKQLLAASGTENSTSQETIRTFNQGHEAKTKQIF